jgi:hypothetical protein
MVYSAFSRARDTASTRAQKVICVGTGRDGTYSIADIFQWAFDRAGQGQRVMHEYQAREFHHAFSNYCETGSPDYLSEIRRWIDECPYDCIVGNGYAPVLPLFAERWGREATLVHIRRVNRTECIESLKKNCELFPAAYRYYSESPKAVTKRMAAFHFDEMTMEDWNESSMDQKFSWYYDKSHSLVAAHKAAFASCFEITTESISGEATRRLIALIATGSDNVLPPPRWLNAHRFDIAKLPADRQDKMQWLFGRLDLNQVAYDEVYAIKYFLENFVAWTGYQIDGSIEQRSPNDIRAAERLRSILDEAQGILSDRLKDVDELRKLLAPTRLEPSISRGRSQR